MEHIVKYANDTSISKDYILRLLQDFYDENLWYSKKLKQRNEDYAYLVKEINYLEEELNTLSNKNKKLNDKVLKLLGNIDSYKKEILETKQELQTVKNQNETLKLIISQFITPPPGLTQPIELVSVINL
jgi:chromosome segregation ATPase